MSFSHTRSNCVSNEKKNVRVEVRWKWRLNFFPFAISFWLFSGSEEKPKEKSQSVEKMCFWVEYKNDFSTDFASSYINNNRRLHICFIILPAFVTVLQGPRLVRLQRINIGILENYIPINSITSTFIIHLFASFLHPKRGEERKKGKIYRNRNQI